MDVNLDDFTIDYLNTLKFKDLHKLSQQFRVNKRWAKKQDIINSLLNLKNTEFRDSKDVFRNNLPPQTRDDDRRLTFTIETPQRATNSRETFDLPQSATIFPKPEINPKTDRRLTFDVPQKDLNALVEIQQSNITQELQTDPDRLKTPLKIEHVSTPGKIEILGNKIKMLTIPSPKVLRRVWNTQKDSNLKVSKKSIAIKKASKISTVKQVSTATSIDGGTKASSAAQVKATPKARRSLITVSSKSSCATPRVQTVWSQTNTTVEQPLKQRKSETTDSPKVSNAGKIKVSFLTPPVSMKENRHPVMPLKKTPGRASAVKKLGCSPAKNEKPVKPVSKIPKAKPVNIPPISAKPLTATKMPDFASIHKKNFDRMESIDEYQQKRAERARRLFRSPTLPNSKPAPANTTLTKKNSPGVFHFKSIGTPMKKSVPVQQQKLESLQQNKVSNKTKLLAQSSRTRLQRTVKEDNRTLLQTIRTNKRFDLQMKFRDLKD